MAKLSTMSPTVRAILDVCKNAGLREGDALPDRLLMHHLVISGQSSAAELADAQDEMARVGLVREEGNSAFLTREGIAAS